eukprot:c25097_g1_i3 orf=437-2410(+)
MLPYSSLENLFHITGICIKERTLSSTLILHAYIRSHGLETQYISGYNLISLLGDAGGINNNQKVVDTASSASLNALIKENSTFTPPSNSLVPVQVNYTQTDPCNFVALLKACARLKDLKKGREIHLVINRNARLKKDPFVCSMLVNMYAKCGFLAEAQEVFDVLPFQDVVTWTALIAGYVQNGNGKEALNYYEQMQLEGVSPNAFTLSCILKVCGSLGGTNKGRQIHAMIASDEALHTNLFVVSALVDMYAKSGNFVKAEEAFGLLSVRDMVLWTALISGYVDHERGKEALKCFAQMQHEGISPSGVTYACVLKACGSIGDTEKGRDLHGDIAKKGLLKKDLVLGNALIDMYAKCGSLQEACKVFDKLQHRDAAVWCCMIAGCTELRQDNVALDLFQRMLFEGIKPNDFIFSCTLKACGNTGALEQGRIIHDIILKRDFALDVIVGNTLIDMYTKCGCLKDACGVFDQIDQPDVISWSAMIAAYGESRNGLNSFRLFLVMESRGIHVNEVTFLNLLKGCARIEYLDKIRTIHAHVITRGLTMSGCLENTLVDVYAKCGKLEDANHIFKTLSIRNVVSWSALIMGHAHHEFYKEALMLFHQMQGGGIRPNATTYVGILKVTAGLKSLEVGKCIHFGVSEDGLETELFVGSALVDMYAK